MRSSIRESSAHWHRPELVVGTDYEAVLLGYLGACRSRSLEDVASVLDGLWWMADGSDDEGPTGRAVWMVDAGHCPPASGPPAACATRLSDAEARTLRARAKTAMMGGADAETPADAQAAMSRAADAMLRSCPNGTRGPRL